MRWRALERIRRKICTELSRQISDREHRRNSEIVAAQFIFFFFGFFVSISRNAGIVYSYRCHSLRDDLTMRTRKSASAVGRETKYESLWKYRFFLAGMHIFRHLHSAVKSDSSNALNGCKFVAQLIYRSIKYDMSINARYHFRFAQRQRCRSNIIARKVQLLVRLIE